jgi:hypothetical protein
MKLIELAHSINNEPLSKCLNIYVFNDYGIGRSFIDNMTGPNIMASRDETNRTSYEKYPFDSDLYTSNQTKHSYRLNDDMVDINLYRDFTDPNHTEKKHIDMIEIQVRHNIKHVENIANSQSWNFDERPLNVSSQPVSHPVDYVNSDERPIMPNPNLKMYGMQKSNQEFTEMSLCNNRKPVSQSFSNSKDNKIKLKKTVSVRPKEVTTLIKEVNTKKFLKRRSKLAYDPMRAVQDEKDKYFDDSQSVVSMSRLSNVKSRTDSNLRPNPVTRKDFRNISNSNSQIIQKRKSIAPSILKTIQVS